MIDVLYAGAANLAQPSSGMDIGSRAHFEELSDDPLLAVDAVSVSPTAVDPAVPPRRPVRIVPSDLSRGSTAGGRLRRKLGLLARGGILFQTGFLSDAAAAHLSTGLTRHPDVLVIDHIAALANLSLPRLLLTRLRGRTKIVAVSHDISSELLRDRARMHPSRLKAIAIHLHALHCHLYEATVFALAHRVFFVSTDDRNRFRPLRRAKTDAMCQVLELPPPTEAAAPEQDYGPALIFVGSPSFFPNAFAIEWITNRFAPALVAARPDLTILLVGKGTDRPDPARPANVVGLGFVDDDRLYRLLRASYGALSPVIHGAGIKIKVLEAIAAGCAIFATDHSLAGYDFMQIEPLLKIDDPAGSAARVAAIAGDPARLAAYRAQIDARWQAYKRARRGRLAEIVRHVASPAAASATGGNPVAP